MVENTATFADLMQRARKDDPEAMSQLCQQYEGKLRVVARVLLGPALRPHLDSMDLVQSVHRTLMLGLREDKFDISTPDKLLALALTIVRRKVARHWRRLQRQKRLSSAGLDRDPLPDLIQNLGSGETDPAQAAQSRDAIEEFCRRISETEREILQMRADGFSTDEIAKHLELKPTTLRVRMTRLRERLRSQGAISDWV